MVTLEAAFQTKQLLLVLVEHTNKPWLLMEYLFDKCFPNESTATRYEYAFLL